VGAENTNGGVLEIHAVAGPTAGTMTRFISTEELPFAGSYRIAASGDIGAIVSRTSNSGEPVLARIQLIERESGGWVWGASIDTTSHSIACMALHGDTLLALAPQGLNEAYPGEKVMQGFVRYYTLAGPRPDIVVTTGKKKIARGGTLTTKTATTTLTIINEGEATLADLDIRIEGEDAGDFLPVILPSRQLAAGESMALVIQADPASNGTKTARVVITSNDSDENPYPILLRYAPRR